jgi:hypothetical protein
MFAPHIAKNHRFSESSFISQLGRLVDIGLDVITGHGLETHRTAFKARFCLVWAVTLISCSMYCLCGQREINFC